MRESSLKKASRFLFIIVVLFLLRTIMLPRQADAQGTRVLIQDAIRQGLVDAKFYGSGDIFFQKPLAYKITNKRATPVTIVIPLGFVFDPDDIEYQSLIIAQELLINLTANGVAEGKWFGFCINLSKHAPAEDTSYHPGKLAEGPLYQVIQSTNKKAGAGKLGGQFAVWRITDNFTLESLAAPDAQNSELIQLIAPLLSLARPEIDLAQDILADSGTELKFYTGTPPPNLFDPGGILNPGTRTGIPEVDNLKKQVEDAVRNLAILGGLVVCLCLVGVIAIIVLVVMLLRRK